MVAAQERWLQAAQLPALIAGGLIAERPPQPQDLPARAGLVRPVLCAEQPLAAVLPFWHPAALHLVLTPGQDCQPYQ